MTASRVAAGAAFAVIAMAGLAGFADYGISYDELQQRRLGALALDYVLDARPAYLANPDGNRLHGPAFEMLLAAIERGLDPQTDVRTVFQVRHLATFAAFFAAVVAFYLLVRRHTASDWWGLAGVALLVLSPRIWSEAFYNSKDIGFLACFVIAATLVDACVARPTAARAAVAGLAIALAVDVRLAGAVLLPLAWALLAVAGWQRRAGWPRLALVSGLLSIAAVAGVVLFWPLLWPDPWPTFVAAWQRMSRFPWNGEVLYLGELIRARDLPWHYLPVWIGISTPPATTALALLGGGVVLARLGTRAGWRRAGVTDDLLVLGWFALPLLVVLVHDSVVYDGWRQLYFVYPAMVLLAVTGLRRLWRAWSAAATTAPRLLVGGALGLVALNLAATLAFMVRWHPHQHVYLNRLAGGDRAALRQRFELDYWGLANRQLLEAIVADSDRDVIRVHAANYPGRSNALMLPPAQRRRVVFVPGVEEADYFTTTFRGHPQEYPYPDKVVSLAVAGTEIAAAYRVR